MSTGGTFADRIASKNLKQQLKSKRALFGERPSSINVKSLLTNSN